MQIVWTSAFLIGMASATASAAVVTANFELLTWGDGQATGQLPAATGLKPSKVFPTQGDWLTLTPDDEALPAGFNPQGSLSHNFADMPGLGGPSFNNAPSLSGAVSLSFSPAAGNWNVSVGQLAYTGQATPVMFMNQFLVTPQSPAAQNGAFGVDGIGNSGTWNDTSTGGWTIEYDLDFYFATSIDGEPSATDIDATFNDVPQAGYLLPTSILTPAGLADLQLDDPAGFYAGDFETYLLDQIAPRLPTGATYLLVTQADKVHPSYTEAGLPITTGSLIGNTTFAFTTASIPEPTVAALFVFASAGLARRRRS